MYKQLAKLPKIYKKKMQNKSLSFHSLMYQMVFVINTHCLGLDKNNAFCIQTLIIT